jgi:hypothetical protein
MLPDNLLIGGKALGVGAWRRVAAVALQERDARKLWPCDCNGATCDRVPGPGQVLGEDWSHCPYPILRSPAWAAIVQFERLLDVSAPPEWPLGLACWLVKGVYGLRLERRRGTMPGSDKGGSAAAHLADLLKRGR